MELGSKPTQSGSLVLLHKLVTNYSTMLPFEMIQAENKVTGVLTMCLQTFTERQKDIVEAICQDT